MQCLSLPPQPTTFIAKELYFTLWLFEFFSIELKVNISVAQNNLKIAKRISKVWKKREKAMFIFPILDFSLDLEDQILVWRRQASSRLRLKR